jgi:L-seryl-tRNA(Ser) seleniumtransferase
MDKITSPRDFPSIEELATDDSLKSALATLPRPIAVAIIREEVSAAKEELKGKGSLTLASLHKRIKRASRRLVRQEITRVINAAGIVVHTNLGRSPLAETLFEEVKDVVTGYGNIEYDLARGKRGKRGLACERYLAALAGAEAGTVVNNNAAALMMILNTLANRKEVIVSRGELVQIGGGFRIPDILRRSGSRLVEVGTTNITTPQDYEAALGDRSGLILKVHQSNFHQDGFTQEATIQQLIPIAEKAGVPLVNDLGSGVFVDTRALTGHSEPTVQQSVRAGAHLTCFSGDKLLGGVQAGLIVGRSELVRKIKRNPLFRAVRVDKYVFAMVERTLRLYLDESHDQLRLWQMLDTAEADLYRRGKQVLSSLGDPSGLSVEATQAFVGGGALPQAGIPSVAICFDPSMKAAALEKRFRDYEPPIIGRIEGERFMLDLKAVAPGDIDVVVKAIRKLVLEEGG